MINRRKINKIITPKEKAQCLVDECFKLTHPQYDIYKAKQVALIMLRDTIWGYLDQLPIDVKNYWIEVEQEIGKL
jgi:hypothetical protein